ncbi:hypothetical protein SAMN06295987_12410, partial [Novosphingobium mathurense]
MTKSILLLILPALLAACQASETPADGAAALNDSAAVDTGVDERAIRGQIDQWGQLVKA